MVSIEMRRMEEVAVTPAESSSDVTIQQDPTPTAVCQTGPSATPSTLTEPTTVEADTFEYSGKPGVPFSGVFPSEEPSCKWVSGNGPSLEDGKGKSKPIRILGTDGSDWGTEGSTKKMKKASKWGAPYGYGLVNPHTWRYLKEGVARKSLNFVAKLAKSFRKNSTSTG